MAWLEKILKIEERQLKKLSKEADLVLAFADKIKLLSDEALKQKTIYFRDLLKQGKTLDDIKYEAFAVAREAATRTLKMTPFKVQIIGALVLHGGNVAEMRTGEGKTLTATMAVYLNALSGQGVHVITVNEYLAKRDAEWMGVIYQFLGLTVGVNLRDKSTEEKQLAYQSDITYSTNSELGFDYLRDNMTGNIKQRVLRGLPFAIIDEADSILIDESRTPLIISGGAKTSQSEFIKFDRFVKSLKKEKHFTIDVKTKTASLTDAGANLAEMAFNIRNLYSPEHADKVHRIHQSLKANFIMVRDVDYLVDPEKNIQIIDQFTGRILKGREFSDGLHQAIQAKEDAKFRAETITMATITYQNFFRLYKKLGGMTGTAKTEEEEFIKIYNMKVVSIPTNVPIRRHDDIDLIYASKTAKLKAILKEIKTRHEKKQPLLIGTPSVEASEELSKLLKNEGLQHFVLNAKNHASEAEIVRRAGEKGSITIATNMAGRGTDIKIDDEVRSLGGLCVLGTERHEARRIDNQLRGRSGRQGDPGYSRFFVSLDDDLMVRFGSDALRNMFKSLGDEAIENRLLMNAITGAQKRIEGQNFDIRKNVLDYDNVLAKQRSVMYRKRDAILMASDVTDIINEAFTNAGNSFAMRAINPDDRTKAIDGEKLKKLLEPIFLAEGTINAKAFSESPAEEVAEDVTVLLIERYKQAIKEWPAEVVKGLPRQVLLKIIDMNWPRHIDAMDHLRQSIHLRSYAQSNPLQDYVNEGFKMFKELNEKIAVEFVGSMLTAKLEVKPKPAAIQLDPKKIGA
ncbi:MAG: preprotein translocase subunit SecA [Bacillota bacterium]